MHPLFPLTQSPLATDAIDGVVRVQRLLGDEAPMSVEYKFEKTPDEYDFFILRVGHSVAELLASLDQLLVIPEMLANYRETPSQVRAGLNRHKHIVYHVENYLIRTQGVADRVLKLLDAVFHLLNDERSCREDTVLRNAKVTRTEVPKFYRRLKKLLERYSKDRNQVVHQHSLKDDALRRLEMHFVYAEMHRAGALPKSPDYKSVRQELSRGYTATRKREFVDFNKELIREVHAIFDQLYPHFQKEARLLLLRVGRGDT